MARITLKDGVLSSESYVKVSSEFTCAKGTTTGFTMDWPEGVTSIGAINITNLKCPCCGEAVVLPKGKHYAKDGVLVSEPSTT